MIEKMCKEIMAKFNAKMIASVTTNASTTLGHFQEMELEAQTLIKRLSVWTERSRQKLTFLAFQYEENEKSP